MGCSQPLKEAQILQCTPISKNHKTELQDSHKLRSDFHEKPRPATNDSDSVVVED